ncbi:helix-turn-helix transcriptional regulator [uncultured Desulfuromusa sp.]|uniref:helix-turn-helix domain-containing protein n=1 Tax=uncultured Desulfuromusa sp. TaxID=219183 RepID=UPI002AA60C9C|nr:helix-turn-helix transcriptional regulator [uncultured Desulfuromusa sp.]
MNTKVLPEEKFIERVEFLIKLFGSAEKLAKETGISARMIGKYKSGDSVPGMDALISISKASGYSIDWLATGHGPKRHVENVCEEESPYGLGWNKTLMTEIVEAIEEACISMGAKLIPSEKSRVITRLYEIYAEEGTKVKKEDIRRHLKLVI